MAIIKRKYERVVPRENAFAALGRRYTKIGRIKDISMGGLAFEYISAQDTDGDTSRIDIFIIGDVFHLPDIPCEVVYDVPHPLPLKNLESIKRSPTRRCGVQFGEMTKYYLTQLKQFLECQPKN